MCLLRALVYVCARLNVCALSRARDYDCISVCMIVCGCL